MANLKHQSGKVLICDRGTADRLLARSEGKWSEVVEQVEQAAPTSRKKESKKSRKNEDTQSTGDTEATE